MSRDAGVAVLKSPLRVPNSKAGMFSLNLNQYRNAHYQVLNSAKRSYKSLMFAQIQALPELDKISLTYTLYPKDRRICDLDNMLAVQCKFFQDALVELGRLPEDNIHHIRAIDFRYGEVDKDDPRVEIEIESYLSLKGG